MGYLGVSLQKERQERYDLESGFECSCVRVCLG
jgi:hypothetical protein